MIIFSWEDVISGRLRKKLQEQGFSCSAVATGGFDGLHIGHRAIIDKVLAFRSASPAVAAGVVTFRHPPKSAFGRVSYSGDLSTLRLKNATFADWGLDFAVVIDFSDDFSKIKGKDFLSILKDSCSMQFVAAGSDFRCGYKLDTGVAEMAAYAAQNGFSFVIVDDVLREGERISSSLVRKLICDGFVQEASKLLGRPYTIDCEGADVSARDSESGSLLIARGSLVQVLPVEGSFSVTLHTADSVHFSSVLFAESHFLRLDIPPEYGSSVLDRIDFIKKI
ncbi:MAG: FAD synthetase family protein [Treponemataceae bacterium]|nr:FAD synthetase family protein [Treponemataceae bacterium]